MKYTGAIIIGAGQAGLAMSRSLADRGIEHVLLEKGTIAQRWRDLRWESLCLLTPNWLNRMPGWAYQGSYPDGFMSKAEVIRYLERYAASFDAPVETETKVECVRRTGAGYHVITDRGEWTTPAVVIATGDCQVPAIPDMARTLPHAIRQIAAPDYANAGDLAPGGVLVVGASSSGLQLADEIHRAGRPVTLSVGRHTRMPRRYRGRDIMWWLDRLGILDEAAEAVPDLARARRQPSLQLSGRHNGRSLDLAALRANGIRIVGRTIDAADGMLRFAGDLAESTAMAERKLMRLIERIEHLVRQAGAPDELQAPEAIPPVILDAPARSLDLARAGIRTVIWATGYSRHYPWLRVPVLDEHGEIIHRGGITPAAGLYVLGLRFLRRRKSNFIGGVGRDAQELADHLGQYLAARRRRAA